MIPSLSETAATPRSSPPAGSSFLSLHGGDRPLRAPRIAIARPLLRGRAALALGRVLDRARGRARRDRRSTSCSRPRSSRCARSWSFGALVPLMRDVGVRARLPRPRARARAVRGRRGGSRCGSTGRERDAALGRRAARARRRAARRRRRRCSSPARPATRRRRRRARSSLALDWLHLAAGLALGRRPVGLLVLWRSLPAAQRRRRPRRLRAALLERRVRLGARAARLRHRRVRAPPADARVALGDVVRQGDPRQGGAPARRRSLLASVNLLRTKPGAAARADAAAERGGAPAPARRAARCCSSPPPSRAAAVLSSLPPPPKALAGARQRERARRPGPGRRASSSENGYRSSSRVTPNRAAVPNDFAVRHHARRRARSRRATSPRRFTMLDMEMPAQSYALARASPGPLRARGARARDGRALGALVRRSRRAGGAPFTVAARRPGGRMRRAVARRAAASSRARSPAPRAPTATRRATTCSRRRSSSRSTSKVPKAKQRELVALVEARRTAPATRSASR